MSIPKHHHLWLAGSLSSAAACLTFTASVFAQDAEDPFAAEASEGALDEGAEAPDAAPDDVAEQASSSEVSTSGESSAEGVEPAGEAQEEAPGAACTESSGAVS